MKVFFVISMFLLCSAVYINLTAVNLPPVPDEVKIVRKIAQDAHSKKELIHVMSYVVERKKADALKIDLEIDDLNLHEHEYEFAKLLEQEPNFAAIILKRLIIGKQHQSELKNYSKLESQLLGLLNENPENSISLIKNIYDRVPENGFYSEKILLLHFGSSLVGKKRDIFEKTTSILTDKNRVGNYESAFITQLFDVNLSTAESPEDALSSTATLISIHTSSALRYYMASRFSAYYPNLYPSLLSNLERAGININN